MTNQLIAIMRFLVSQCRQCGGFGVDLRAKSWDSDGNVRSDGCGGCKELRGLLVKADAETLRRDLELDESAEEDRGV